jgi:N-methylhydantoinase A
MHEAAIPRGIVPNYPGQFSAYGFTMADARSDRRRSVLLSSRAFDYDRANAVLAEMTATVERDLRSQGYEGAIEVYRALEMRYLGQNYELSVPVRIDRFAPETIETVWQDFHRRFAERYQFNLPGEPIELVDMAATAVSPIAKPDLPRLAASDAAPVAARSRRVVYEDGAFDVPVYDRAALLAGQRIAGPALVEEAVSVTVLRPGYDLLVDPYGSLEISAPGAGAN